MIKTYSKEYIRVYLIEDLIDIMESQIADIDADTTNINEFMDSLDSVSFIMKIEQRFDIQYMDADAEELSNRDVLTINDMVKELEKFGIVDIKEIRRDKLSKINRK